MLGPDQAKGLDELLHKHAERPRLKTEEFYQIVAGSRDRWITPATLDAVLSHAAGSVWVFGAKQLCMVYTNAAGPG